MTRSNRVLVFLCALTAPVVQAEPLHVPAVYPTIQSAIDAAGPGDEIHIAAGVYREILEPGNKSLTLIGAGAGQTVLSGDLDGDTAADGVILEYRNELVDVLPFVTLRGLTMTDAQVGLRISRAADVEIGSCGFVRCSTAGVQNSSSPIGSMLRDFVATGSTFEGPGGGIVLGPCDAIDISDCRFKSLTKSPYSGFAPVTSVVRTSFVGCSAGSSLSAHNAIVSHCRFEENDPDSSPFSQASALSLYATGAATIEHTIFRANGDQYSVPTLRVEGESQPIEILNCEFDANRGSFESAVAAIGVFHFEGCTFTRNVAGGTGPINLSMSSSTPSTVTRCRFENNGAIRPDGAYWPGGGGGLCVESGTLIFRDSVFANNIAETAGAIMLGGISPRCVVERSRFLANRAGGLLGVRENIRLRSSAGAIYAGSTGRSTSKVLAVSNSVFIGNTASDGVAGAIEISDRTSISGCVFIENAAKTGSTLYHNRGYLGSASAHPSPLTACIVVSSVTAPAFESRSGPFSVSSSLNLISPLIASVGFTRIPFHGGDGFGDDPRTPMVDESVNDDFGDLRLLPGSPAIDAGGNAKLPRDVFDLDRDGDTLELLVGAVDLAGNPRFVDDPGTADLFDAAGMPGAIDLGPNEYRPGF